MIILRNSSSESSSTTNINGEVDTKSTSSKEIVRNGKPVYQEVSRIRNGEGIDIISTPKRTIIKRRGRN